MYQAWTGGFLVCAAIFDYRNGDWTRMWISVAVGGLLTGWCLFNRKRAVYS